MDAGSQSKHSVDRKEEELKKRNFADSQFEQTSNNFVVAGRIAWNDGQTRKLHRKELTLGVPV
jgi:hypothetical protein